MSMTSYRYRSRLATGTPCAGRVVYTTTVLVLKCTAPDERSHHVVAWLGSARSKGRRASRRSREDLRAVRRPAGGAGTSCGGVGTILVCCPTAGRRNGGDMTKTDEPTFGLYYDFPKTHSRSTRSRLVGFALVSGWGIGHRSSRPSAHRCRRAAALSSPTSTCCDARFAVSPYTAKATARWL